MKNINLNIPENGTLPGTCKYVASYLLGVELRIINNGDFCLQMREVNGPDRWETIVKTRDLYGNDHGWQRHNIGGVDMSCVWESENMVNDPYNKPCLFGYLTKAAQGYAWDFINLCAESLADYINSDESEVFNLKITKK